MRKKQLPKRIEILRKAFENKWSLEAVNKELEDNLCERLYARNIYEAGLIYAFCLGFDYENWKQLYTAYEEERKDARDYIQSPEKNIIATYKKEQKDTDFGEKSLSIVLKPGYAPEEQYRSRGIQGPWTDIYALSATIYKCITGITPEESMQRVIEDSLEKPSKYCKDIPKGMENAIMKGMAALQKNRYQNLKEFCEALYSDFEDAGEEKKKPVSKSDGTLKSVNEEKEKAKSGQNALGTGMEKLQNLTKKQKMIAGAAVILVVLLIFAGTSLSGGKKQNSSTSNLPTEREMVSDVVKNSQWEGTILNLSIIDDDINRQYEVYTADCEIESKRQGGSGTTSKAKITYKLQDDEWVFVKCEKQN